MISNESLFNKIKDSQSLKIFDGNIHLFNKNNIFMSDKKLLNWKVQNKISAVIIRPDMHVYGCCDFEDIIV